MLITSPIDENEFEVEILEKWEIWRRPLKKGPKKIKLTTSTNPSNNQTTQCSYESLWNSLHLYPSNTGQAECTFLGLPVPFLYKFFHIAAPPCKHVVWNVNNKDANAQIQSKDSQEDCVLISINLFHPKHSSV